MAVRLISEKSACCFALDAPKVGDDLAAWLSEVAQKYSHLQLTWLLAHADDGVIWGHLRGESLSLSYAVTPHSPALRRETLRELRFFSEQGEVLLWRDDDGALQARVISEAEPPADARILDSWNESFDEVQLLWGNQVESVSAGFSCVREGRQGLRHAPPLALPLGMLAEPLRLDVRQYLAREEFARVATGRLLNLRTTSMEEVAAQSEPLLGESDEVEE